MQLSSNFVIKGYYAYQMNIVFVCIAQLTGYKLLKTEPSGQFLLKRPFPLSKTEFSSAVSSKKESAGWCLRISLPLL
jgi:hypothetical protein